MDRYLMTKKLHFFLLLTMFEVFSLCIYVTNIFVIVQINQLTKHLVYIQLTRYMGRHIKLETEEALSLSQELLIRYRDGLKFGQFIKSIISFRLPRPVCFSLLAISKFLFPGENLLSTDLQYSDNYLLLAVHLLLDVWTKTG